MSNLDVLLADGNSAAARRARVKLQPRDKKGRWVPTGATLLAAIRGLNGIAKKYKMKAIGGTATSKGEKNKIRALLLEDAPELGLEKNTVLEVDPKNGELESKIKLDRDYLKKKGIDPDLQHTLPKSIAEQPQDVSDMNPQPADDLDIELANGGLSDDEDKDFRKERENEPLAKLPPGLEEQALEGEEVSDLVSTPKKESGILKAIKDFFGPKASKSKMKKPALVNYSRMKEQEYPGRVVPSSDHGYFNYVDANGKKQGIKVSKWNNGQVSVSIYRGRDGQSEIHTRKNSKTGKWEIAEGNVGASTPKAILGEFDSAEDARKALFSGVNEEAGFSPDNDFSMGAGITALRKRNENPRTKHQRDWIDLDKPTTEEAKELEKLLEESNDITSKNGDYEDAVIKEAFEDALFGGEPDIDELIEAPSSNNPEEVGVSDLAEGDVISLGKLGVFKVARVEKRTKLDGTEGYNLYVDDYGREALVNPLINKGALLPGGAGIQRIRKAEAIPAEPTPEKPEKPEKPKATRKPRTQTPKPKSGSKPTRRARQAPKSEEVNKPNRKDDGKMIAPSSKSVEELREKKINNLVDQDGKLLKVLNDKGKARAVEDPNAVIDALLEENPNAKIKEDGTVVVERGEFTDTDGKKYIYEVGVQRTVGNQFMERYTIKDAETGEVAYDFYNADYKDSFGGLYGKTSGLTRTRDLLLGRDVPGKKGTNSEGIPVDKELANYFGPGKNIDQRLKYLRKTKDMNNWRLLTPEENIEKYLTGRSRELNKSDTDSANYKSQFGNVRRSFVASTWEAIDLRDNELLKERLVQLLGRLPNTPESVDKLINTFKEGIAARYKGTPREKELQTLPINMKKFLEDASFDLRTRDEVPFVSEDGVSTVKVGDRVRFINNEGDMVVGEVVKLNAGSGKNGGFKDTARVRFGNQTVDNLQTRNMLHTEDEVTDYQNWVRNDEKLKRRAEELGIDFEEYKRRKEDNPDFDPGDSEHASSDAGAPYLDEGGEGEGDAPSFDKPAEELLSGDPIYNEDGDYIGTVIAVQEVPAKDGGEPGIAVKYLDTDGSEKVEVLDRGEVRGPK